MKRVLFITTLALLGCDDDEGGGGAETSSGSSGAGTSSTGEASSSEGTTTEAAGSTTTGSVGDSSGPGSGASSGGSTGADEGSTSAADSSTGADAVVGFAQIQLDLENAGGAQGDYPSCIDGVPCHQNPARNVVLVADPTPAELMQNYQNILDAPGVPWVTPMDDTAQMLNEVPIPDDVRARWLAWIEAGAPFE